MDIGGRKLCRRSWRLSSEGEDSSVSLPDELHDRGASCGRLSPDLRLLNRTINLTPCSNNTSTVKRLQQRLSERERERERGKNSRKKEPRKPEKKKTGRL